MTEHIEEIHPILSKPSDTGYNVYRAPKPKLKRQRGLTSRQINVDLAKRSLYIEMLRWQDAQEKRTSQLH